MKKRNLFWIAMLLIAALLAGCGSSVDADPEVTEPSSSFEAGEPTADPTEATVVEVTEPATEANDDDVVSVDEETAHYLNDIYAEQIKRYHTALSEKWDENKYVDNEMSALVARYYEENPMDNVGFGFLDLDNDGSKELIIGAILNAEQDPTVFEIWTVVNGEPVMLARGGARNRYVLQFVEEDNMWYVVNEASNSAANSGTYYLMLSDGELQVMQGIVFNAEADENNPWFMAFDMDWDASNDEAIDEETANAILESNQKYYIAVEYLPYNICR